MATETTEKVIPGLTPYRFTVDQFEAMIAAGVLPDGVKVELIAGVPVEMTKNEPHNFAVGALTQLILPLVPEGYHFRQDLSARAGRRWRPEPDVAIVRGERREFTARTPDLDRFAFLIEVSDTSYAKDRSWKWRRYAASRVPAYGILDLNRRRLELFTEPGGRGKAAAYARVTIHEADSEAPVILDGREVGRFRVADVLP